MRIAVEADVMKTDLAAVLALLAMVAEVDLDGFGAATLGVLDGGTLLLAGRYLLTGGTILHTVVELEVAVEFDGHLQLVHREAGRLAAGEGRGSSLGDRGLSTLAVEGPLGQGVTLAEAVGASPPSTEVEVVIRIETAGGEIAPAVARLLFVRALVVAVGGVLEDGSIAVPGSSDLLGSQARDQKSRSREPHGGGE